MNPRNVSAPSTGGGLSAVGFRMMDRALTDMEEQGDAIVNMMDDLAIAQATGQGLHVNLAV